MNSAEEILVREILDGQTRLETKIDIIDEKLSNVRERVAKIEGKASLFGAISGLIAGAAITLIARLVVGG